MSRVPSVVLNNGIEMPRLGFGVWQVPDEDAADVVATALAAGYRKIATAAAYYNEAGVGKGGERLAAPPPLPGLRGCSLRPEGSRR